MSKTRLGLMSRLCAVVASCLLAQGVAHAVPSTVTPTTAAMIMTGQVTNYWFKKVDPFNGTVGVGTAVNGTYIVDPGTAYDQNQADNTIGLYTWDWSGVPGADFSLDVGGNTFTSNIVNVEIRNRSADIYRAYTTTQDQNSLLTSLSLTLWDPTGTAFTDDSFVLEPDIADFQSNRLQIYKLNVATNYYSLSVLLDTSVDTLVDPPVTFGVVEPPTSLLLGMGLLVVGLGHRYRLKEQHLRENQISIQ